MLKIKQGDRIKAVLILGTAIFLIILSVIFLTPNNFELMTAANTSFSVDGTRVSVGIYNYFYGISTRGEVLQSFDGYNGFDSSIPFDEQYYADHVTWEEYFHQSAVDQIVRIVHFYNCGLKSGVTLLEEQKAAIDEQISILRDSATQYGVSLNDYLSIVYGKHIGERTIIKILEMSFIAQNYYEYLTVSKVFSYDDYKRYFIENQEKLTKAEFEYFEIQYDGETREAILNEAKGIAGHLEQTDCFNTALTNYYGIDVGFAFASSVNTSRSGCILPESVQNWVFDDNRAINEITVIADDRLQSVYVLKMVSPAQITYDIQHSVRELFVASGSDLNAEATVTAILDRIYASDDSEYTFAAIADIYNSGYSNSSLSGGLVVGITRDDVAGVLEEWIFDQQRTSGDMNTIKGERGYYIYYYITNCEGWMYIAKQEMIADMIDKEIYSAKLRNSLA